MDISFIAASAQPLRSLSISLVAGLILYLAGQAFYNLFLHPLSKYPGPIVCRISKLPWDYWQLTGVLAQKTAKLHRKYGDIIRLSPNELSFTNPQAWKDIYAYKAGKEEWPKSPIRAPQSPNGPTSIINAGRDDHARFRRLLSHAFSEKGLQEQEALITKYINLLVDRLGEVARSGETTNLVRWYNMAGFDIISDLGWGAPFDCLKNGEVHEWITTLATTLPLQQMVLVFREHGLSALAPFFIPKRMQKDRASNFKYARARVEDRINFAGVRGDFWDRVMIKSVDDNVGGEGMSKEEMIITAVTLVFTGSETATTVLSGAAHFLGKNPQCMKKFVHEIRTSFSSPDEINAVSINRLKYTTAVLEETMRLYPPVITMLWRVPPKGGAVACGDYIPEGTVVNLSMPGTFQDPAHFHRPYDFVPERWMPDAPAEFADDNRAAFHPFGVGTRNCLGQNLAYMEMRLIMAKVFWHYDMELDELKTGDWLNQRAWGVWRKKPLWVKFGVAQHVGAKGQNGHV